MSAAEVYFIARENMTYDSDGGKNIEHTMYFIQNS